MVYAILIFHFSYHMKVLIFGGNGMLGHKLVQVFEPRFETWSTIRSPHSEVERFGIFPSERTIETLDIRDYAKVGQLLSELKPNVVVNCVWIMKKKPTINDVIGTFTKTSLCPQYPAN